MRAGLTAACSILLALAGCRSPDPARYSSDGRLLEDMEPLLYRVAVAPVDSADAVDNPAGDAADSRLRFARTHAEVQRRVAQTLRDLKAANEIVELGSMEPDEIRARRVDLVIVPREMERPYLRRSGYAQRAFLSAVLWITTWIGGVLTEDREYEARFSYDFEVVDPHTGEVIATIPASSDRMDLRFTDRQKGAGWLQSLIIPPFWTWDNADKTSARISDRMCEQLAGHVTRYFKETLVRAHRDVLGELRLQSPRNGEDVGPTARLQGKVIATEPLTELAAYLNEQEAPFLDQREGDLPAIAQQSRGAVYQVPFDVSVALEPGGNRIHFEFRIAGRLSTRTVVLHNGPEALDTPQPGGQ